MKRVGLTGVLDEPTKLGVYDDVVQVLEEVGVEVESDRVRELLHGHGCKVVDQEGRDNKVVLIPREIIGKCLTTVPRVIKMFGREGDLVATMGSDNVYFNPGSCATTYYDCRTDTHRSPTGLDLTRFVRVAEHLPNIHLQSTAMNVTEADERVQDATRLHIVLSHSKKPIVTGTFGHNFEAMKDMLVAVRGSEQALKEKPYAIFSVCPLPALKWPKVWGEDVMNCAKFGIPAEPISMPQPSVASPITMYDSLVQHAAETLSGVVISQLTNPGAPFFYGGSPNMPWGQTSLLGNPGTAKFDVAYAEVGKLLGIPTQAYLGLSDSKTIDVQAGKEKGISLLYAVLAGINNISGPGMLESENCQSTEMLVIDNEFCGDVLHLREGIIRRHGDTVGRLAMAARRQYIHEDDIQYLSDETEFRKCRLADTLTLGAYQRGNGPGKERQGMLDRAMRETRRILTDCETPYLDRDKGKELDTILNRAAEAV